MKQVKPTLRVLMPGAGAPGAAGIIRCLRENGERPVYIVGVDMNPNAGGRALVDAFYCIPSAKDPSLLSVVTDICLKERVEVILPIVTKELFTFASHKAELAALGIRVSVMDADRLYIANDKGRLLSAVRAAGLPTPRFCLVNTYDELISAIWAMGYPEVPVCVKATDGNGSRGVRIVDRPHPDPDRFFNEKPNSAFISLDYLEKTLQGQSLPTLMVMEYLPGDEYSVDVLADQNGVRDIVCRRGLRVVSSIQTECVLAKQHSLCATAPYSYGRQLCGRRFYLLPLYRRTQQ